MIRYLPCRFSKCTWFLFTVAAMFSYYMVQRSYLFHTPRERARDSNFEQRRRTLRLANLQSERKEDIDKTSYKVRCLIVEKTFLKKAPLSNPFSRKFKFEHRPIYALCPPILLLRMWAVLFQILKSKYFTSY